MKKCEDGIKDLEERENLAKKNLIENLRKNLKDALDREPTQDEMEYLFETVSNIIGGDCDGELCYESMGEDEEAL